MSNQDFLNGPRKALYDFHKKLIDIESISGSEFNVVKFTQQHLESLGYHVEWLGDDKTNIYAYKGDNRNTKVLLTSHLDTVPPYFPYRIEDDKIYGRGSVDDKNCVAAMVEAVEELEKEEQEQVGLLFVVDEEVGGTGMQRVNEQLGDSIVNGWKTVIFGEPTEMKLGVGHKGIIIFNYQVKGKAAHSGYPELGINANDILLGALSKLLSAKFPVSDLLGESTVNIGQISGGVAINVIPEFAEAKISVRVTKDTEEAVKIVQKIADDTEHLEVAGLHYVGPELLDYKVDGFESIILKYATDVPYLKLKPETKRYLYGSGSIHVAHSDHEYVNIKELHDSVDGYKKLVRNSLRE